MPASLPARASQSSCGSAALPLRAGVISGDDLDEQLLSLQGEEGRYLAAHLVDAASALLLAGVIFYLYRCTKARRAELISAALVLGVAGALAYAVSRVASALVFIDLSDDFAGSKPPADLGRITDPEDYLEAVDPSERAEALARESNAEVISFLGLGAVLALGFSLLLLNLNAMRAGLLSRFMGVLGMVLAVLFVLGGGPPPVIYAFWLGALGALFLNRWPGGRGPAWETGEATPWPSAADARLEAVAREEGSGEGAEPQPPTRKRSRKKKRR